MTMLNLKRFKGPVTRRNLSADPSASFDTEDLGVSIDVTKLNASINVGIANVKRGASAASLDEQVAWDLYQAFNVLPDLLTSDIQLWQWLTLREYRDFAEARTGMEIGSLLKNEDFKRVLGAYSLNGMNRQVMWKLFLAARSMGSEALTRKVCSNQDRLVSVFDRHIGKNDSIARALVESVASSGTVQIQKRITRVNAIGESRLLDYLDPSEIKSLSTEV